MSAGRTVKMTLDALTANTRRRSLQVATLDLIFSGDRPVAVDVGANPAAVDMPASWFTTLKYDKVPVTGKETGFVYLTREGYEANRDLLRRTYEAAGGSWPDFEAAAEEDFAKRATALRKAITKAEAKLTQLQAIQQGGVS